MAVGKSTYKRTAKSRAYKNRYNSEWAKRKRKRQPDWYRWKNIKGAFGLTKDEFFAIIKSQDNACGICRRQNTSGFRHWHVDHDHNKKKGDTGFVRGILCGCCNMGGGMFNDSPDLLLQAAKWFSK